MAFVPSYSQTGEEQFQTGKGYAQVLDNSLYKIILEKNLRQKELAQQRQLHEADAKQKADEMAQQALFKHIDSLPNDIYAPKDEAIKKEKVQKISDYVYAHPELYDTKSPNRVKSQLELNNLIADEKTAAMRSAQWYKEHLKNGIVMNQELAKGASLGDFYNADQYNKLSSPETAGDYTIVQPQKKADIDEYIMSQKGMRGSADTWKQFNQGKDFTIDLAKQHLEHDLRQPNELSLRNAHDFASEPKEVQNEYIAKYGDKDALVQYGLDKHEPTLQYLVGQKKNPEHPQSFYNSPSTPEVTLTTTDDGHEVHANFNKPIETRDINNKPVIVDNVRAKVEDGKVVGAEGDDATIVAENKKNEGLLQKTLTKLEVDKAKAKLNYDKAISKLTYSADTEEEDKVAHQQALDTYKSELSKYESLKSKAKTDYAPKDAKVELNPTNAVNTFSGVTKVHPTDVVKGDVKGRVIIVPQDSRTNKENSVSSQPKTEIVELKGNEDPKTLVVDKVYSIDKKQYKWNGKNLIPIK